MEAEVKIKKKDGSTETVKYGPQEKYQKENIQRVVLKLNKKTDADILDWLNSLDNKQGAIKEALRMRIAGLAIQRRCNIPTEEVIPQLKPSVPVMLMKNNFSNCENEQGGGNEPEL